MKLTKSLKVLTSSILSNSTSTCSNNNCKNHNYYYQSFISSSLLTKKRTLIILIASLSSSSLSLITTTRTRTTSSIFVNSFKPSIVLHQSNNNNHQQRQELHKYLRNKKLFYTKTKIGDNSISETTSNLLRLNTRNSISNRRLLSIIMSSTTTTDNNVAVIPGRPTWQQTMLRIKDPKKSIEFYCNVLGMTLIDTFDFPQYKFKLYFVTTLSPNDKESYKLKPGTQEAHDYLWNYEGVTLELTYNYGTDDPNNTTTFNGYHPGNAEKDGFGHIAVSVNDVYATSDKLLNAGYTFKKKPNEGRMKGLAFVYDPDGYWVEIVNRGRNHTIENEMNFSQTMLRIKDPKKSLEFYKKFGMKLLSEKHFSDFSLYFLGSSNVNENIAVSNLFQPILELTHNHGTENDISFKHYNGNENDRQGFGHIGFLVDNVYDACDAIKAMGYGFRKEPDDGNMKGLAFAYDPDGYSVEIIKRGGIDFGDTKN